MKKLLSLVMLVSLFMAVGAEENSSERCNCGKPPRPREEVKQVEAAPAEAAVEDRGGCCNKPCGGCPTQTNPPCNSKPCCN